MDDFIETDAGKIYNGLITSLEKYVKEPLYPGDERRIFAEALAAVFISMFNAMNDAAKQKMLRYARGEVLDALGERVGVKRMSATTAGVTVRFSINSPFGANIVIPQGTRLTGDSTRYFATTVAAVIYAGQTYVDVSAESVGTGTNYNGIAAGIINTMVDAVAYIDSVENITVTEGAVDEESDDNLRERILAAPSALSTAGPVKGYRYWAMTADPTISDVVVTSELQTFKRTLSVSGGKAFKGGSALIAASLVVYESDGTAAESGTDYTAEYSDDLLTINLMPEGSLASAESVDISIDASNAGVVRIVPICQNGILPSEDIINKVYAACNADNVRPMTDIIKVEAPSVEPFDIEITYYTTVDNESACIETLESEGGAIDEYIAWQCGAIGRDINPDKLRAYLLKPDGETAVGATRVTVTKPVFKQLDEITIAQFSGKRTVRHEVVEE